MSVPVGVTVAPPTMTWPKVAVVRAWTITAAVGFAFLVAQLAFHVGGPGLENFAERWVYDGLELLAAAGCLLRAATIRNERAIWTVLGVVIVNLAYPAADLVLLAIVIFVFVVTGLRPGRAWAAAGIAFGAIAVADSLF